MSSPDLAAEIFADMADLDREQCHMMALDTKHRLITYQVISIGSVDQTFMSPREIYLDALRAGASCIILAHNHPSGDSTPSEDDLLVTKRIAAAGELLGIQLLDHLVIGAHGNFTSLARAGAC